MHDFEESKKIGKKGEEIFRKNFLEFLGFKFRDVSDKQAYQIMGIDFKTEIGQYEIKANYKDNENLLIEECSKIEHGKLEPNGWFYTTKARMIVFVSNETETMIFLPLTDEFRTYYESIKNDYRLFHNQSSRGKKTWRGAFRVIPFEALKNYISIYIHHNN